MRVQNATDPVYTPNSVGGPAPDHDDAETWSAAGEFVRSPYLAHPEDDDVVQPNALINDVKDDGDRVADGLDGTA